MLSSLDALWTGDLARREHDGTIDNRLDSATLALPAACRVAAEAIDLPAETRDRLDTHVETTLDGLERDTGDIRGSSASRATTGGVLEQIARKSGPSRRRGAHTPPRAECALA